jgi:ubiquinone/menaquinone biosynthesis C-methylase UbiE
MLFHFFTSLVKRILSLLKNMIHLYTISTIEGTHYMNDENYYDTSHSLYIEGTVNTDVSFLYDQFTSFIPEGAYILDAGWGSGRDMLYFKKKGFRAVGFDSSIKMVESASSYSMCPVFHMRFEEIEFIDEFDAIWACASFLHVRRENVEDVFNRLHKALKSHGILYCSFKSRSEDFIDGDRHFTCFTPPMLEQYITSLSFFSIEKMFMSEDARQERKGEMWTNAILRAL